MQCTQLSEDGMKTQIKQDTTHYNVKIGETVNLPCEIENRKDATVIWQFSKSRIPETLTVGFLQYRQDYRIRIVTNLTLDKLQTWDLEIRKIRIDDEGYYICRVMAEPESVKRTIYLKVEVDMSLTKKEAIINDNKKITELFCNTSYAGSNSEENLNLKIKWFKDSNEQILNEINRNYQVKEFETPSLSSKLVFYELNSENTGIYYCQFNNQNMSIQLGEMHTGKSSFNFIGQFN